MTSKSWVNWPKCVHKWFWNAYEAEDQVFYCHLLELSQNGTERATRGWRDWEVVVNTLRIIQTSSCWRQSQWMQTWFLSRRWIFDRFRVNVMWNALVYLVMTLLCLVHGHAKTDGSVTQHHGSWRDTSPRMARLLASMLWDIVIDVLELYASRARADPSRPLQTAEAIQECMDQQIVFGYFFWRRWGCYQEISVKYAHTNHKIADILTTMFIHSWQIQQSMILFGIVCESSHHTQMKSLPQWFRLLWQREGVILLTTSQSSKARRQNQFQKGKEFSRLFCQRWEGVNSTPHRARITHANIFSRVAQA